MSKPISPELTAVILAGGSSRRFAAAGTPIDKLTLTRDGESLLEQVVDAARGQSSRVVVVGPTRDIANVEFVQESPPGGGPVAALAAALDLVRTDVFALLAGDAPRGPLAIPALLDAIASQPTREGAYLVTDRAQYLCAVYRTGSLRAAIHRLDRLNGRPLRALLDELDLLSVTDPDALSRDIDTPADARDLGYA